jgi:hypothetical protein
MTTAPPSDPGRYVAAIRAKGLSIYDPIVVGDPTLWIPAPELQALLDDGLRGLSLAGLPLRTRSKVVKTWVCEVLGYLWISSTSKPNACQTRLSSSRSMSCVRGAWFAA